MMTDREQAFLDVYGARHGEAVFRCALVQSSAGSGLSQDIRRVRQPAMSALKVGGRRVELYRYGVMSQVGSWRLAGRRELELRLSDLRAPFPSL